MSVAPPEVVAGIDFAGPATAAGQRRKIITIAATRVAPKTFTVTPNGLNARLLQSSPGRTAAELVEAILSAEVPVSVVAADFPFSLPTALLESDVFAACIRVPSAFRTWEAFNAMVSKMLPLRCPLDYSPFLSWRDKAFWLKRTCDITCAAQPPLKDRFQVLFNMTLLGNAFLGRLEASGRFDVVPFQARGRIPVIEVYPGHAMRALGVPKYKRAPGDAIDAVLAHLSTLGFSVDLDPLIRRVCETYNTGRGESSDFDAADALVAAAVAMLRREGTATAFAGAPSQREEGAIWSIKESAQT